MLRHSCPFNYIVLVASIWLSESAKEAFIIDQAFADFQTTVANQEK